MSEKEKSQAEAGKEIEVSIAALEKEAAAREVFLRKNDPVFRSLHGQIEGLRKAKEIYSGKSDKEAPVDGTNTSTGK